jgi:hypothetical protein
MDPVSPYETTLATVDAGRAGTVAQLRSLADRLERLAGADAAEALVLLEAALSDLWRQAGVALERASVSSR